MNAPKFVVLLVIVVNDNSFVSAQTTPAYLDECIKDKALPASHDDNYIDCKTDPEAVKNNELDCCFIDREVKCCNKWKTWLHVITIIACILGTTIILAVVCFIVFWCERETCSSFFTILDALKLKCRRKRCCNICCKDARNSEERRLEERREMEEESI